MWDFINESDKSRRYIASESLRRIVSAFGFETSTEKPPKITRENSRRADSGLSESVRNRMARDATLPQR